MKVLYPWSDKFLPIQKRQRLSVFHSQKCSSSTTIRNKVKSGELQISSIYTCSIHLSRNAYAIMCNTNNVRISSEWNWPWTLTILWILLKNVNCSFSPFVTSMSSYDQVRVKENLCSVREIYIEAFINENTKSTINGYDPSHGLALIVY